MLGTFTLVHLFQLKRIQAGKLTTILYLVGKGKFAPSHTKSKQQQHLHLNPGLLKATLGFFPEANLKVKTKSFNNSINNKGSNNWHLLSSALQNTHLIL